MWLMKKSRKFVPVMTSMKDECVSLLKPQSELAQLHDDDDEDVFATSLIDRYGASASFFTKHVPSNICTYI